MLFMLVMMILLEWLWGCHNNGLHPRSLFEKEHSLKMKHFGFWKTLQKQD